MSKIMSGALTVAVSIGGLLAATPATAQYRQKIGNDMSNCASDAGPAVLVTIRGIKSSSGKIRLQSYRATKGEWLKSGRWLNRIELPAKAGAMTICMPVPEPGSYAFAARHDVNGNDKTDISTDGGAMSNNPSINIFNLGKPSVSKTAFSVGQTPRAMTITMKYM